ncbi:MAG: exosortase/archaeosortase family protein [Candidatus Riflebacteria bacterium]|nr:exosortase/archaeosortase family protein [Candidatus Riflebacteria bacterium]
MIVLFLLPLLVAAIAVSLPRLLREMGRNPTGEHAGVVVVTALLLALKPRHRPALAIFEADSALGKWFFAGLFAGSVACIIADAFLEEEFLLAAGLWLGIPLLLRLWRGDDGWQRMAFPWLLLVYCLPLPQYVTFHWLHSPLQQIGVLWTTGMLVNLGHDAWYSGTVVHIGPSSLQIVEECSGVRFLTALTFLALLLGHWQLRRYTRLRIMVFVLSVPLAILVNVLRLSIAGEITGRQGSSAAASFIHGNWILLFYFSAIAALIAGVRLIKNVARSFAPLSDSQKGHEPEAVFSCAISHRRALLMTTVWLMLITVGSLVAVRPAPADFVRPGFADVKICPPGWHQIEAPDSSLNRVFTPGFEGAAQSRQALLESPSGEQVKVEVIWWPGRRPRNRLIVFHQAMICSTGIYAAASHSQEQLGSEAVATSFINEAGVQTRMYYWLQSTGKLSSDPFKHALWQYWLELRGMPADGCFIMVATADKKGSSTVEITLLIRQLQQSFGKWL